MADEPHKDEAVGQVDIWSDFRLVTCTPKEVIQWNAPKIFLSTLNYLTSQIFK